MNFVAKHFVGLSFIAYAVGILSNLWVVYRDASPANFLTWKLTQYYVNYIDLGFVKRGLVGTIIRPVVTMIGDDAWSIRFAVLGCDIAIFAAVALWIRAALCTLPPAASGVANAIRLIFVFSPVGAMQFAFDAGRFDHLNFLLLGLAFAEITRSRYFLAGLIVSAAVLVHEAAFIYGFPALLACCLVNLNRSLTSKAIVWARATEFMVGPTVAAIAVATFGNTQVDLASVFPKGAGDGVHVWQRGLLEPSLGLNLTEYVLLAFYALGPFAMLHAYYRANHLKVDFAFVAALAPLSLFALGTDYARWCQLLFLAACVPLTLHLTRGARSAPDRLPSWVALLFIVYILPLGPVGITHPLPYVAVMAKKLAVVNVQPPG